MIKIKIEKILVISFIGFIIAIFAGLGGSTALKAELPATLSKTDVSYEKRLQKLEADLAAGTLSKQNYDSLADILRTQLRRSNAVLTQSHNPDKMPEWVSELGVSEPDGMKFDQVFSDFTSVDNPDEGFNSVSLVYTGDYEIALEEAAKIAGNANLEKGRIFNAKGSPVKAGISTANQGVSYMNYRLNHSDKDFLISLEVEPSGHLIIMVTDNKQLNERLLMYEPLSNRHKGASKQKKQ